MTELEEIQESFDAVSLEKYKEFAMKFDAKSIEIEREILKTMMRTCIPSQEKFYMFRLNILDEVEEKNAKQN